MSFKNKLICFDLDGVLVDACDLHKVSLERAMMEVVGFVISDDEHYSRFNGLSTKNKLKILGISNEQSIIISDKKQLYTLELIEKNVKVDNDKVELLKYLLENKYSLACVTNSIFQTAKKMLEKSGIYSYFDLVVSNESVKNQKPYPDPYIHAMAILNFHHSDTIIIEDSEVGLKSAYASGANVIKVSNPSEVNLKNLRDMICKF